MRRVVLYQLLSLDGVAEEPGDWMPDGGPELVTNLGAVVSTQHDVLLGRRTYDHWAGYWPTADVQPFADFVNGTRKHVFTASPPASTEWPNTEFVTGDAVEHVERLRQGEGGDIGIHGSIRLAQSLLRADVVDRLHLVIAPVLAGNGGRRLFTGDGTPRHLHLADATTSRTGVLFLHYTRPPEV